MNGGAPRDGERGANDASQATTAGGQSTAVEAGSEGHRFKRIRLEKVSARQRKRIKHVDGWEVLVPTKGALSMLAASLPGTQRTQCKLCPLGAIYPTDELAARAADRALIALSGRLASEALLNWPLDEYPEGDCHQLYGAQLARYMTQIVEDGQREMEAARRGLHRSQARNMGEDGGCDVGEDVREDQHRDAGVRSGRRREQPAVDRPAKSLHWLMEPSDVSMPFYSVHATKQRRGRAKELMEQMTKQVAGVKHAVMASTKKNSWEVPTGAFPRGTEFESILASRRLAELESAELVESHADDRGPTSSADRRCRWCAGKHHGSRSQKLCPFLQMALAVDDSSVAVCPTCRDAPGASCGACLRGTAGLPPEIMALHVPLRQDAGHVGWAEGISPAMLDLAISMQRLANAAVSEFGAEHLTAQLTPDALHALIAIAEAMIDDALGQVPQSRKNGVH